MAANSRVVIVKVVIDDASYGPGVPIKDEHLRNGIMSALDVGRIKVRGRSVTPNRIEAAVVSPEIAKTIESGVEVGLASDLDGDPRGEAWAAMREIFPL